MDTPEEAATYDAMNHGDVNRCFVDDLYRRGAPRGQILDVGTGTARIPIELCQRSTDLRVHAIDLAECMLEVARLNIAQSGLADRIELERVDAKQMPYSEESFSAVVSNSIVHHIPDPAPVIREAVRVTARGGRLFFRDLLRPSSEQQLDQIVRDHAGDESHHARQLFAMSLRAALTVDEFRQIVQPLGFGPQTVTQTSDRHWTWDAMKT
jgi:ubiquinone/menaquinone biosynthesis C-methylase UbiE